MGDWHIAGDITQQTLVAAWLHADHYRSHHGTVQNWVLTIARHASIDEMRRQGSRIRHYSLTAFDDHPAAIDLWHEVERAVLAEEAREALLQLPREQGQVLAHAYLDGWSQVQIAAHLQIPLGTVKGRIRLGLQALRSRLPVEDIPW